MEENETEDKLEQAGQFGIGNDSFTDKYQAVSKAWFLLPLSESEDYDKEKIAMQSNLSVQNEESQSLETLKNNISCDASAATETMEGNVAYNELMELGTELGDITT